MALNETVDYDVVPNAWFDPQLAGGWFIDDSFDVGSSAPWAASVAAVAATTAGLSSAITLAASTLTAVSTASAALTATVAFSTSSSAISTAATPQLICHAGLASAATCVSSATANIGINLSAVVSAISTTTAALTTLPGLLAAVSAVSTAALDNSFKAALTEVVTLGLRKLDYLNYTTPTLPFTPNTATFHKGSFWIFDANNSYTRSAQLDVPNAFDAVKTLPFSANLENTYSHSTPTSLLLWKYDGTTNVVLQRSTDNGASWSSVLSWSRSTYGSSMECVDDGAGNVVLLHNDVQRYYYSSDDGATWTTITTPPWATAERSNLYFSNGKFAHYALTGSTGRSGWYSTDMISWTAFSPPETPQSGLTTRLTGLNGIWLIAFASGNVWRSTNLTSWVQSTYDAVTNTPPLDEGGANPTNMFWDGAVYTAVWAGQRTSSYGWYQSIDGSAWTLAGSIIAAGFSYGFTSWFTTAQGNGQFYAAKLSLRKTVAPNTVELRERPWRMSAAATCVASAGRGVFRDVGTPAIDGKTGAYDNSPDFLMRHASNSVDSSTLVRTADGINYDTLTGLTAIKSQALCYGGGVWVIVGSRSSVNGKFSYSNDQGATWTDGANGTNFCVNLQYANGLFFWFTGTNTYFTSTTGSSWSSRTADFSAAPLRVVWNATAGLYLFTDTSGYDAWTTPDLTNGSWVVQVMPPFGSRVYQPGCVGGLFIVPSVNGALAQWYATSPDAVTWTYRKLPDHNGLNYLINQFQWHVNGRYYISYNNGTDFHHLNVYSTADGLTWQVTDDWENAVQLNLGNQRVVALNKGIYSGTWGFWNMDILTNVIQLAASASATSTQSSDLTANVGGGNAILASVTCVSSVVNALLHGTAALAGSGSAVATTSGITGPRQDDYACAAKANSTATSALTAAISMTLDSGSAHCYASAWIGPKAILEAAVSCACSTADPHWADILFLGMFDVAMRDEKHTAGWAPNIAPSTTTQFGSGGSLPTIPSYSSQFEHADYALLGSGDMTAEMVCKASDSTNPVAMNFGGDQLPQFDHSNLRVYGYSAHVPAFARIVVAGAALKLMVRSDPTTGGDSDGYARLTHQNALTATNWNEVAFTRVGSNYWLFLNGVKSISFITATPTDFFDSFGVEEICDDPNKFDLDYYSFDVSGWVDCAVVSKYAKYTSDYTPAALYNIQRAPELRTTTVFNASISCTASASSALSAGIALVGTLLDAPGTVAHFKEPCITALVSANSTTTGALSTQPMFSAAANSIAYAVGSAGLGHGLAAAAVGNSTATLGFKLAAAASGVSFSTSALTAATKLAGSVTCVSSASLISNLSLLGALICNSTVGVYRQREIANDGTLAPLFLSGNATRLIGTNFTNDANAPRTRYWSQDNWRTRSIYEDWLNKDTEWNYRSNVRQKDDVAGAQEYFSIADGDYGDYHTVPFGGLTRTYDTGDDPYTPWRSYGSVVDVTGFISRDNAWGKTQAAYCSYPITAYPNGSRLYSLSNDGGYSWATKRTPQPTLAGVSNYDLLANSMFALLGWHGVVFEIIRYKPNKPGGGVYTGEQWWVRKSIDLGVTWSALKQFQPFGANTMLSVSGSGFVNIFNDGFLIPIGQVYWVIDPVTGAESYLTTPDAQRGVYTKDFDAFEFFDTSTTSSGDVNASFSVWNDEIRVSTMLAPEVLIPGTFTVASVPESTYFSSYARKGIALTAHPSAVLAAAVTCMASSNPVLSASANPFTGNVQPMICVCNTAWGVPLAAFITLASSTIVSNTATAGLITAQENLNGALQSLATCTPAPSMTAAISMSGAASCAVTAMAAMSDSISMSASGVCASLTVGAVTALVQLNGAAVTVGSINGTLVAQVQLAAVVSGLSASVAALLDTVSLAAAVSGSSTPVATLNIRSGLLASATGQSTATAGMTGRISLTGSAVVTAGIISAILSAFVTVPLGVVGNKPVQKRPNTTAVFTKSAPLRKVG